MSQTLDKWLRSDKRLSWLYEGKVRPYFSVSPEGREFLNSCFHKQTQQMFLEPFLLNPKEIKDMYTLRAALAVDKLTFHHNDMVMPDWVFYDCAVLPGVVCGFVAHESILPKNLWPDHLRDQVEHLEWIPVSLFIMIPSVKKGEWVAHNLCSINFTKKVNFYGLGFLSKLFGMLYAGVDNCLGMTQWDSPALRVHSFYGPFCVKSSYNLLHSCINTLTYSLTLDESFWPLFFDKDSRLDFFHQHLEPAGFQVDPSSNDSLKGLHEHILESPKELYLNPLDVVDKIQKGESGLLELFYYKK